MPWARVASTCAIPINLIMSKAETTMVRDLDLVKPTVIRPKQSSVFGWGSVSIKVAIKKTCAGLCDHGYCSSAFCRVSDCRVSDGFHAKRSGKRSF